MAFKLAEAVVDIKANDRDLDSKLSAARGKLSKFADAFKNVALPLGLTASFLAATNVMASAARAAGDFNETIDKSKSVLGTASGAAERFADSMASAFGNNRREMLDAVTSFASMAKATGSADGKAAEFGKTLTRLADDSASLFNTSFTEAFAKIRSGLAGESEPLRAFNIFLSESAVQARAAQMGYTAMGGSLSESAKIMARASLIQEGLSSAMGNHAQTQGSYNNQLKEFQGRLEDVKISLGQGLLPALNGTLQVVNPLLQGLQQMGKELSNIGRESEGFAGVMKAIGTGAGFGSLGQTATTSLGWRNAGSGGAAGAAGGGMIASASAKLNTAGDMFIEAARQALEKEKQQKQLAAAIDKERTAQAVAKYQADQKQLDIDAAQGVPQAFIPVRGGGSMFNPAMEGIGAAMAQRNRESLDQIKGIGQGLFNMGADRVRGVIDGAQGLLGKGAEGIDGRIDQNKGLGGVSAISSVDQFNADLANGAANAGEETVKKLEEVKSVLEAIKDAVSKGGSKVAAVFS